MKEIDRQYLATPFCGSRRMKVWLGRQGYQVNRKRVQRLMRTIGLTAIYRRPRTSKPAPGHKIYPYLLRGMEITRPNSFRGRMGCGHHLHPHGQRFSLPGPSAEGWTGLAGACWLGVFPTPWMLISASRHLGRRLAGGSPRSSTPTKGASSPARVSLAFWSSTGSRSAWMERGAILTTYSWSGCSER